MSEGAAPSASAAPASARRVALPEVSVVVPAFDEAPNMPDLVRELAETLRDGDLAAEVVLVDDGSSDGTAEAARRAADAEGWDGLRVLRHRRNRGKTQAILTGARAARGRYLVLFDADLQHSPREIPRFVERLREGWDVVAGRKVGPYRKRFVSGVYNWLARRIFGLPVHDLNAMKAFRREVLEALDLRKDWHRYLLVLAHDRGFRIAEIEVQLYPRRHGTPKYEGLGRVLVGTLDLLAVWFQLVCSRKPMLFFGVTGVALLSLGALTGLVALYLRFVLGQGYRPLLTLVLLLMVMGTMLFALGFLGELVASLRSDLESLRRAGRLAGGEEGGEEGGEDEASRP